MKTVVFTTLLIVRPASARIAFTLVSDWRVCSRMPPSTRLPVAWSMGIGPNSPIQQDLFDTNAEQFEKMKRLDAVIDRINKVNGSETIVLGSQLYRQKDGKGKALVFADAIKHDFKSKNPTTRWSDIIVLK